ncbi:MAG: Cdc6/Cdc18 family protein [Candidatus Heimdallarchaeota archaeon]
MENTKHGLYQFLSKKEQILKDEQVFETNYIPDKLIHREDELQGLATHFSSILYKKNYNNSKHAIIEGPVGVGKTVAAQNIGLVIETFSREEKTQNVTNIRFLHLNCRRLKSWYLLLTSLLRHLVPAFPIRGFSTSELVSYLSMILQEKKMGMLLCLDEIDYVLEKPNGLDVLYSLIRGHENSFNPQISLVIITRNPNFLSILDPALQSSLSHSMIQFRPYTINQMYDILTARAQIGFNPGTISKDVLYQVASMAVTGDTRYAIELLWRSAKIAEQEHSRHISPDHVMKAENKVYSSDPSNYRDLSGQLKLVLSALNSMLVGNKPGYVTTRDLWKKYEELCIEKRIKPRKLTQFWHYLKDLRNQGIITFEVKSRHRDGKSVGRTAWIGLGTNACKDLRRLLIMY